jgi:hypothetical protein
VAVPAYRYGYGYVCPRGYAADAWGTCRLW